MLRLVAQIWAPLLVAALCAAAAGWLWHAARLRPRQKALEAERRRLRAELLDLAVGLAPPANAEASPDDAEALKRRVSILERELAQARGRGAEADVLRRRIADLEHNSGPARPIAAVDVTDYTTRISALEVEIEAARGKIAEAEALQARAAHLDAAAPENDLMRWRARYFEARANYLEQGALETASALAAARAEAGALRSAEKDDGEKNELIWRNRYLTERVKYLESVGAPGSADLEEDNRRKWRMRYLEKRVAHLEAEGAHAVKPAEIDTAPLLARIGELEKKAAEGEQTQNKLIEAEDEAIRSRWTARYLSSRVAYLERVMSAAREAPPAPAPAKETPLTQPAPAPPAEPPIFRMERPQTLSAPRGGAPDDLTCIQGINALNESALRALGTYHYDQIAAWTPAHAAWVNQYLNLRGRIARERWIEQAQTLAHVPS